MLTGKLHGMAAAFPNTFNYFGGSGNPDVSLILQQMCEQSVTEYEGKRYSFNVPSTKLSESLESLGTLNVRNSFLNTIQSFPRPETIEDRMMLPNFLKSVGGSLAWDDEDDEMRGLEDLYLSEVSKSIFLMILEKQFMWDEDPNEFPTRPPKFVPLFVGTQDIGKSLLTRTIGFERYKIGPFRAGWYKGTTTSLKDELEFRLSISGGIVTELTEAVSLEGASEEKRKAELEKITSTYRDKYEKRERVHRINQTYFITTNKQQILKDLTGGTRYYPVRFENEEGSKNLKEGSYKYLSGMKPIWGEALRLYENGERWDTALKKNSDLKRIVKLVQKQTTTVPIPVMEIADYVSASIPEIGDKITANEVRDYIISYNEGLGYNKFECDKYLRLFNDASENLCGCLYKSSMRFDDGKVTTGYQRVRKPDH